MRLLFDENVSHRLVEALRNQFPGSTHVRNIGLRGADDQQIWNHARAHGFTIVSKDTDFRERSSVEGFPPKVIWLEVGTTGTSAIANLLRRERQRIERFETDGDAPFLILSIVPTA